MRIYLEVIKYFSQMFAIKEGQSSSKQENYRNVIIE